MPPESGGLRQAEEAVGNEAHFTAICNCFALISIIIMTIRRTVDTKTTGVLAEADACEKVASIAD